MGYLSRLPGGFRALISYPELLWGNTVCASQAWHGGWVYGAAGFRAGSGSHGWACLGGHCGLSLPVPGGIIGRRQQEAFARGGRSTRPAAAPPTARLCPGLRTARRVFPTSREAGDSPVSWTEASLPQHCRHLFRMIPCRGWPWAL